MNLIKLNSITNITELECRSAKKCIEFFLGRLVSDFSPEKDYIESIDSYLKANNLYLLRNAILKKFKEYFIGKEFEGLIKETELTIKKKELDTINKSSAKISSHLSMEESRFILDKLKIKNKLEV